MIERIEQTASLPLERTQLLKISCWVGFVFIGLTMIMGLFLIVVASAPNAFRIFPELNFYISVMGGKISMGFALLSTILPMISFFGIIQIRHQLKIGFWLFSIPLIIMTAIPFLMIDIAVAEIWLFARPLVVISIILIALFGLNYKNLY